MNAEQTFLVEKNKQKEKEGQKKGQQLSKEAQKKANKEKKVRYRCSIIFMIILYFSLFLF